MLPFHAEFHCGSPPEEQLVRAVIRAVALGQLAPGHRFPPPYKVSQEFRIHPDLVARALETLVTRGVLKRLPDDTLAVAPDARIARDARLEVLEPELERSIEEARTLSLNLPDVLDAVRKLWNRKPAPPP